MIVISSIFRHTDVLSFESHLK